MTREEPTVGEELAMALALALYRKGLLDVDDITGVSDLLLSKAEATSGVEAERLESAAHLINCIPLEAEQGTPAEERAKLVRQRFKVIDGDEGGCS